MIKKISLNSREGLKILINNTYDNKSLIEAIKDLCYMFTYSFQMENIYLMDDIYGDVATYYIVTDFPQWAQDYAREVHEQFDKWTLEESDYYEQFDA